MNQWRSPPEWAGPSGYISGHFAIESSDLFSYSDDCKIFTLRDSKPSPLNKPCSRSRPLSARLSSPLPSCLQCLWSSGSPAAIQFRGSRRSESSEPTQVEPPRASLSPHTEVSPVLFAHPDQRSLRLQTIWSPSVRANAATWTTAFHWRLQMRRSCWARLTNLPPVVYTAQCSQLMAKLICILFNAVEELGFEWSTPEEPPLFEWFLLGRRQAPRQRASPFFPEIHDEITKSWRAP